MSQINREAIYAAMFNLVSANLLTLGFKTVSRRLRHWNDVPPEQQPALFMLQSREPAAAELPNVTMKWQFKVEFYLYVQVQDADTAHGSILNPLIDAIEAAFIPDNADTSACTLGGLVTDVVIEGDIITSEGNLGSQEVAIIPVRALLFN